MFSLTSKSASELPHGAVHTWRGTAVAVGLVLAVAGCTASASTPSVAPSSTAAGAISTASVTPTPTPISSATPTPTPTPASTKGPTAAPTAPPAATPTPLPALAIGLCTGPQLSLTITAWIGDPGSGTTYPHVTATNVSSASCNMRGSSRAEILDSSGAVIADAGLGAAKVASGDPVYALAPNGTINTIITWGNWCTSAPTQNLKVAMVEPFGLGKIVAPAIGAAPVPTCYASGSGTTVSSEAWLP